MVLLLLFGDSRPKNAPRSGSFFNTAAAPQTETTPSSFVLRESLCVTTSSVTPMTAPDLLERA
ncbi:hypothetical protein [Streptomyces olivaceus]